MFDFIIGAICGAFCSAIATIIVLALVYVSGEGDRYE